MSVLIVRSFCTNPRQRIMYLTDVFYIFVLILLLSFVSLTHSLPNWHTADSATYIFVFSFPSPISVANSCALRVYATADRRITTTTRWRGDNTLAWRVRTTLLVYSPISFVLHTRLKSPYLGLIICYIDASSVYIYTNIRTYIINHTPFAILIRQSSYFSCYSSVSILIHQYEKRVTCAWRTPVRNLVWFDLSSMWRLRFLSKMPVDVSLYVVYFLVLVILLILVRVSLVNLQGQTRLALC